MRSHLFIFGFISSTLRGGSWRILLWLTSEGVLPIFSFKSLIIYGLTFRSLFHFEFIFVYGVRKCSSFILLQVVDQFSRTLVKEIVFSPLYILASFVKNKVSIGEYLFLGFLFCSIDLYFFLCVSTILSWWLWLLVELKLGRRFLQFHSSFSRLLWLFEVFVFS